MLFYLDRHERVQAIFTNNGSPDSCPYYDDLLKEDLDTGTSSYEFRVPSNHPKSNEIEEGGYIVRKNLDNELVMFTVIQIEETHSDTSDKYIYAENAGLELLNDIFRPITHMSKNVNQILDIVLADTRWVRGETEYLGIDNFYFEDYQNVISALQYVKDKFSAELNFRVEMKNGEIVGRYVDLVEKRGNDTKKRFSYSKDINSIRRKIDMSDVVTALIGVGKANANGVTTTFKDIGYYTANGDPFNKPLNQDWVGDPDAVQRYGIKGKHLLGVYQYDTLNAEDLLKKTWSELQKRKTPKTTYELDVALLERLTGAEHESTRLGDTVYVIDESFSPALYLEARVRQLETCFSDRSKDKCTLGNFKNAKSNITKDMRSLQSTLLKNQVNWDQAGTALETANSASAAATAAQQTASSAMASASGKNMVYRQPNTPTGDFVEGDMWFETDNGNRLSIWDGSTWQVSKFGSAAVSNLDAGAITTGTLTGIRVEAVEFAGENLSLTGMLSFPDATTETEVTGMRGRYTITEPYASYNSKTLDGTWNFTSSSIGFKAKVTDLKDNQVYYGTSYFGATLVKLRAYTTSSNSAYDGNFTILNNRLDMSPGKFTMGQSGSSTDPDWPDNILITADGKVIASQLIQCGNVFMNGANSLVNTVDSLFLTGKGGATLDIGQDGTGTRVQSADVYNRTYSSPANVYVTELGTIGRSTSARKYKLDEEPIESDLPSKLVEVIPKTWYDKTASEAYSDLLTREMNGENIDWSVEDIPYIERIPGLIAEDVEAAGLSQFVVYSDPDENGVRQVEGLMYDRLWTLLIPLIKELRERVTVLEGGMV